MMAVKKWILDGKVATGMLVVQIIGTGLQLLSRVILNQGSFVFAYMFYRHIVGAVCVAPFALFWERGGGKEMSWTAFFWLFAVALTGISMAMGLFYYGLRDTTATYATNFLNLIPIVTFLFSTILRIEKLRLNTKASKMKVMGAILCLGGALTIAFYKGKALHITHHKLDPNSVLKNAEPHKWTRGTIFLVCSCLSYGLWFTSQAKLVQVHLHKFWATFYTCIIGSVQQVVIGLCIDRSKAAWHLGWNLQLITIFYSGALATAASFWLMSWAVEKRGPTYPSMFNPLSLILVALTEALFLGEPLLVGSLLGMFQIILGVYTYLWAKNKEAKDLLLNATNSTTGEAQGTTPYESPNTPICTRAQGDRDQQDVV
ncbi:hypothetical protein ACH5RR_017326 [Cinchona calisaya]|uniref:WAT1-related protein n=1 Tax=Cinchona calisaya TaxID=153742 RepID=A0ABD3A230_9GENT